MAQWSEIQNASGPGVGAAIRRRVARMVDAGRRYRWYRTTLSELGSLSDHELKDIGLSRSGIHDVAYRTTYGSKRA